MLQPVSRAVPGVLATAAFFGLVGVIVTAWVPLGWPAGKSDLGALHRFVAAGTVAFAGLILIRAARRWATAPRSRLTADLLAAVMAVLALRWIYRGTVLFLTAQSALWP